jgi:hypothetical protein
MRISVWAWLFYSSLIVKTEPGWRIFTVFSLENRGLSEFSLHSHAVPSIERGASALEAEKTMRGCNN